MKQSFITKKLFRFMVALDFLCTATYVMAYYSGPKDLPPALQNYLQSGEGVKLTKTACLLFGSETMLLMIAMYIGLFLFWRPARWLAVFLLVQAFILTPFLGAVVQAPLQAVLNQLGAVLSGVVIALAFFSPAARLFDRPPLAPDAVDGVRP